MTGPEQNPADVEVSKASLADQLAKYPAILAVVERLRHREYIKQLSALLCRSILAEIRESDSYSQHSADDDGAYIGSLTLNRTESFELSANFYTPPEKVVAVETEDYTPTTEEDIETGLNCTNIKIEIYITEEDPKTPSTVVELVEFLKDERDEWYSVVTAEGADEFVALVGELKKIVLLRQ